MTDKPISLSKFRKTRRREEARNRADANAVKFGRSKAEKLQAREAGLREGRKLEGHRREAPASGADDTSRRAPGTPDDAG
ncbi:DUF4169 family protein [Mangrovicoccus algicola]|uniref:DUF4169 family protein n=1 Tax=Mangrovicoccus algicola TaxID=2771008 RepID=A0A8J7CKN7_9RHOB|nr:DUF4169 family protein [Mangrovicoccus algicola]MBE3639061.1 DUF4169 family protein [Mangrovicoccus algicola]